MPFLTPGTAPTATRCRRLLIPDSVEWLELVNGALVVMINERNWEQIDGITPAEAAQAAQDMFLAYQESDFECEDVPVRLVGSVFPYATINPPAGCLPCDGATYNAADYPDLYTLLDTPFILSGTQFKVPDLRGRAPIGAGTGSGLTARAVGASGGAESHALSITEMPAHSHTLNDPGHSHSVSDPGHAHPLLTRNSTTDGSSLPRAANSATPNASSTTAFAASNVSVNSATTGASVASTGSGASHNNMQPFIALKYAIVALP